MGECEDGGREDDADQMNQHLSENEYDDEIQSPKSPQRQSFELDTNTEPLQAEEKEINIQNLALQIADKTFIAETLDYNLRKFDINPAIIGLKVNHQGDYSELQFWVQLNQSEIKLLRMINKKPH